LYSFAIASQLSNTALLVVFVLVVVIWRLPMSHQLFTSYTLSAVDISMKHWSTYDTAQILAPTASLVINVEVVQ
jgi:hypothetical protein